MKPWRLVVEAVAAYRLTKLITADGITQPLREAVIADAYERAHRTGEAHAISAELGAETKPDEWQQIATADEEPPKMAQLITCRWCTGVYVSVGILVVRWWWPKLWEQVADGAALSAAAALLARLED